MKVQYFGDVNDYRKFALLRLLSEVGRFKIGVCWMLTEADRSAHGAKRGYLKQPEVWRAHDPALFDALAKAPASPQLSDLQRIETEGVIPGATFFNEFVTDSRTGRDPFHAGCMATFADRDLVFFDPDNGLEVKSTPKGWKRSSKYVLLDEIADHYRSGRSVLVYQHLGRALPHKAFVEEKAAKLRAALAGASVMAFDSANVVFLMAAHPEHAKRAVAIAAKLGRDERLPAFLSSALVTVRSDSSPSSWAEYEGKA
jgi:hypothetical protein